MSVYYNEIDPYAAEWLRTLISKGLLPDGEVDERSIGDVGPDDLRGFTQCHFFAGIGGWPYALRLAGWADDRSVWTGSCPCQPFSVASVGSGGSKGQSDERHLWPSFFRLIQERQPAIVFGEQVTNAIGWGWLDEVALDLEGQDYAFAAAVMRGDAIGAAHERKRLYWVANSSREGRKGHSDCGTAVLRSDKTQLPFNGDALARSRHALAGNYSGILFGDGVSLAVERCAAKGYGNAIIPQCAQVFIESVMEAMQ